MQTKSQRRMKGIPIRLKYTLLFIATLTVVITAVYLLVGMGLEPYAIRQKQGQIREQISLIANCAGAEFSEESLVQLEKTVRGSNVETVVIDNLQGTPYLAYATNFLHSERMNLLKVLFDEGAWEDADLKILEQTDSYMMCRGYNTRMGNDQIDCVGYVGDDVFYFMTMPLESIHYSVTLFRNFLLAVGLVGIALGGVLIYLVTGSLTRPILKLADISDQMADLRFDVQYEGKETDEIGILGENINHLSHSLNLAISDLRAANKQLAKDLKEKEEIDERRRQFLSNVSHELKTPIALIQGYAEGLSAGITEDPESMAFYCDVIQDEAGKMNQIVKRLLNLDEIESGHMVLMPEVFNLAELVREVAESTRMLAGEKKAELVIDLPEEIPVKADQFMMESVVQNYMSNAWHYVSDPGRVEIGSRRQGDKVQITIFNTGENIPREDIAHIWDKFYKVDKARTRSYGGSGIGLSLVKAVMSAHESRCGVNNRPDGVEFWFELPLCAGEKPEHGGSDYGYME